MRKIALGVAAAGVLLPTASWAVTCAPGQVPASCTSGFINCCMPVGARDLGNGKHIPARGQQGQWHGPRTERDQLRHDWEQDGQRRRQVYEQDRQRQPPSVLPYRQGGGYTQPWQQRPPLLQRPVPHGGGSYQQVQPRPMPQPGPTPGFGRCQGQGCVIR